MSRFFAGESSDSESDRDDIEAQPVAAVAATARFILSDDEEDVRRVVRSEKDKRLEEISESVKTLRNSKKIRDVAKVASDFDNVVKAFVKAKGVVQKEGTPRVYIRALAELEDFVKELWEDRESRKKLSKLNAKALSSLRQKIRKYNQSFATEIEAYRKNPDEEGDESAGSDSDREEEEDEDKVAAAEPKAQKKAKPAKAEPGSDEDDDDFWDMSDDETSSSSDEEGPVKPMTQLTADYFRKRDKDETKTDKKKKRVRATDGTSKKEKAKDTEDWQPVERKQHDRKALFKGLEEITHADVLKKLSEVTAARGKKGVDRSDLVEMLQVIYDVAEKEDLGAALLIRIGLSIVTSMLDYNTKLSNSMKIEAWLSCMDYISSLLERVMKNEDIMVSTEVAEEDENFEDGQKPYKVRGSILMVVERLDDEYTKVLQNTDAHSTEYVDRLKQESKLTQLIERTQDYVERHNPTELYSIYMRRIEHAYYKYSEAETGTSHPESLMEQLTSKIYAIEVPDRVRTRTLLCHVYYFALHDRFYDARDFMLMSHLQESIMHTDVPTQILYNRTMAQLGLCAFRHGMIRDAHTALNDLQSSGRAKELLAQGLLTQRHNERTPEQEKLEKMRQIPFHMHINLELLECVYLTSSMLIEIPYMAAQPHNLRKRIQSKTFHHQLRLAERQPLVGPPETMREHVVKASHAMKSGEWRACRDFIMAIKCWDLFHHVDKVKELLTRKIQEETLRTYLFSYSSVYDSISLETLTDMFELPRAIVHSIVSKMIINDELRAALDEPSSMVVLHRAEPTRLQSLALQMADKINLLLDNNEKIFNARSGDMFWNRQQGVWQHGRPEWGDRRGRRQGPQRRGRN